MWPFDSGQQHEKTRRLIREATRWIGESMSATQDRLDALTDSVNTGVQELRDEIARLASLPAEEVDFSRLQAIADGLAGDNVPAAPVDENPETPEA